MKIDDLPAAYSFGATDNPPRGDYASARADFTCDQDWAAYTPEMHERYRRLYADRIAKLPGLACDEFVEGLTHMDSAEAIPRFEQVNVSLRRATGWEIAAVPGIIPETAFFSLLAQRRFPVTTWLREEHEFNYIVEPDVFHDFFGHVPLLYNPVFADYMQAYGEGGLKAQALGGLEYLARLYWYTVEFGLISTPAGLRIYGAGILSSGSEPQHSLFSPKPNRVGFDLLRVMASKYRIDDFQDTYYVIDSYKQLFDATAPDFTPYYAQLRSMPTYAANEVLASDRLFAAAQK
jgi:phenylalanine-4-hydroxylase